MLSADAASEAMFTSMPISPCGHACPPSLFLLRPTKNVGVTGMTAHLASRAVNGKANFLFFSCTLAL